MFYAIPARPNGLQGTACGHGCKARAGAPAGVGASLARVVGTRAGGPARGCGCAP